MAVAPTITVAGANTPGTTLTVSPNSGLPQTAKVNVSGDGFHPSWPVDIYECATDGGWPSNCTQVGTADASAGGSFGPVAVVVTRQFTSESGGDKFCGACAVVGFSRWDHAVASARIYFGTGPCARATIFGTPGPDNIKGTAGPDVIAGLGGGDTIDGLAGNDVICTEEGDDLVYGGLGNDRIYTGDSQDRAYGGPGNDRILGGDDSDHIFGDEGDDTLNGGNGFDYCQGDTGNDSATYCEWTNSVP